MFLESQDQRATTHQRPQAARRAAGERRLDDVYKTDPGRGIISGHRSFSRTPDWAPGSERVVMVESSRTPDGIQNLCPACGSAIMIEPSVRAGDVPCPHCGHGLWFTLAWEDAGSTAVIKPTCVDLRAEDLELLIARSSEMPLRMRLVLDLSDVQYMPSAAIASLLTFKKKLAARSGTLTLENLHPSLLEVFRITRLDRVFDIAT
jgi:anti-anti-sigma factor